MSIFYVGFEFLQRITRDWPCVVVFDPEAIDSHYYRERTPMDCEGAD